MQNKTKTFALVGGILGFTLLVATQVSANNADTEIPKERNLQNTRITNAQEAYQEGKITDRQMEILEAREELKGMGRNRGGEKGRMKEFLNEKGLNVTCDEMQEMRELMETTGLRGNQRHNK